MSRLKLEALLEAWLGETVPTPDMLDTVLLAEFAMLNADRAKTLIRSLGIIIEGFDDEGAELIYTALRASDEALAPLRAEHPLTTAIKGTANGIN